MLKKIHRKWPPGRPESRKKTQPSPQGRSSTGERGRGGEGRMGRAGLALDGGGEAATKNSAAEVLAELAKNFEEAQKYLEEELKVEANKIRVEVEAARTSQQLADAKLLIVELTKKITLGPVAEYSKMSKQHWWTPSLRRGLCRGTPRLRRGAFV